LRQTSLALQLTLPHAKFPPLELVLEPELLELPVAPLDVLVAVLPVELVLVAPELELLAPVVVLVLLDPLVVLLPPVPVVPPPLPFDAEEPQAVAAARMKIEAQTMRKEVMRRTIDENRLPGSF
jgi:hypothetical protein